MAKAIVIGCACVVVSELTPDEIEGFKQFRPEDLRMEQNGEDFRLSIDHGPGHLESEEAVFSYAKSADGKATITLLVDPDEENKMKLIQEQIGPAMLKLERMEKVLLEKREFVTETRQRAETMFISM